MGRNEQPWIKTEKNLIMDVVESRNLSLFSGKYLNKAEELMESFYPGKKALLLNSGTAALHIALKIHGIGIGDEVILPSITYPATALAIIHSGATPVFAEISPQSFTLDPTSCNRLTSPKTKAVIFVHLFGVLGNIEAIAHFCKSKGIILIEDCAQAFGSNLKGKQAGTFGQAGCFSFFESKTISAGEGGALIVSDQSMLELGRRYRHHGMDVLNNDRSVKVEGFNYKPSEFQSAMVFAQLKHSNEIIKRRLGLVRIIYNMLLNKVKFQSVAENEKAVLDKICLFTETIEERNKIEISGQGIGLFRYLNNPLYKEPIFSSYGPTHEYSISEYFCDYHLVFQISPYQKQEEIRNNIQNFITILIGGNNKNDQKKIQN